MHKCMKYYAEKKKIKWKDEQVRVIGGSGIDMKG